MGKSERAVQSDIRLMFSDIGEMWRNNVGVLTDERGVPVRYGLCNDSKELNQEQKSSDLVGITPVVITELMLGQTLGVFTGLECKREDWVLDVNDRHTKAQMNWHDIVRNAGGYAGFVRNADDVYNVIKRGRP